MGCQASVPVKEASNPHSSKFIGKTERGPRQVLITTGGTERFLAHANRAQNPMVASNSSRSSKGGTHGTVSLDVDEEITNEEPKIDQFGHLMPEEVVRRTSSSLSVSSIRVGNREKEGGHEFQVTYAYRSQRGYYPDDPKKANQDKYGITLNFAGEPGDAMFAIYDGHGGDGHSAAQFAKKKLPQLMATEIRKHRVKKYTEKKRAESKGSKVGYCPEEWPLLEQEELEACCRRSFLATNEAMHGEKSFNDRLCGTTAATVIFHGGKMTVCNVGDSRVILGHRVPSTENKIEESKEEEKVDIDTELINYQEEDSIREGEVIPIALTRDQTPYRKDERERVEKAGAEIRSVEGKIKSDWGDFVHGEIVDIHGDPPRIWLPTKDYPGTAFTRSLGDSLAEQIGVTADPEIITKTLTQNDEYLVIASDGIFEFLTNKFVMDVCVTSDTPLEACDRLTRAAYDQWLIHENRTDDITVIVCFLNNSYRPTVEEEPQTTESLLKRSVLRTGDHESHKV